MELWMCENCNFVVPVNILTLFECACFSLAARHTIVCLDCILFSKYLWLANLCILPEKKEWLLIWACSSKYQLWKVHKPHYHPFLAHYTTLQMKNRTKNTSAIELVTRKNTKGSLMILTTHMHTSMHTHTHHTYQNKLPPFPLQVLSGMQ